jgi:glyoxylase-like metal-dependent hydrolase (beta-lactamase superfamily II)
MRTEHNNALVIDPGAEADKILNNLKNTHSQLKYILLTHGHFDHIGAVSEIKEAYPEAQILISKSDEECLLDRSKSLASVHNFMQQPPINADRCLGDNDVIEIDELSIRCIHTPGHTKGSMCFVVYDTIFTGDTIFADGIGRTDLYGGSYDEIVKSIKKVYQIMNPSDENPVKFLPGHGFSSLLIKQKFPFNLL